MICCNCGKEVDTDEAKCEKCSHNTCLGIERKSRVIYILLAVFLGWFGAHNFYAGYIKRALFQLLLSIMIFTIVFEWFWVLFDILTVDKDSNGCRFRDHDLKIFVGVAALVFVFVKLTIMTVMLLVLVPYLMLLKAVNADAECSKHLLRIAESAISYANAHEGVLPANLQDLKLPPELFKCTFTDSVYYNLGANVSLKEIRDPENFPILIEAIDAHGSGTTLVIFANATEERIPVTPSISYEQIVNRLCGADADWQAPPFSILRANARKIDAAQRVSPF